MIFMKIICLNPVDQSVYATMNKEKKVILLKLNLLVISLFLCCSLCGCQNEAVPFSSDPETLLTVHFIDVGQADAMLITSGDHAMMIDTGNDEDAELILDYLKDQGISHLDYLIGTHAHEDHIGSLDDVLLHLDVDLVMMPEMGIRDSYYDDVMEAVEQTRTPLIHPEPAQKYSLGKDTFTIVAPVRKDYREINNSSIVLRYVHGQTSILFTGDMEIPSEQDVLDSHALIRSDILKAAHHGCDTSSSTSFLDAVQAEDVVISVGRQNPHALPDPFILRRFEDHGMKIHRTDLSGTLILESDGHSYRFNK